MPRAIWTGTISFGLVNIPVRVYPATRRKDVRFHEIDRQTGQRIGSIQLRRSDKAGNNKNQECQINGFHKKLLVFTERSVTNRFWE